jgi:hypothetical protein
MLVALLDRHFIDYKFLDSATLNVRTVAIAMLKNLSPRKSIADRRNFASLVFPLTMGAVVAVSSVLAVPSKVMAFVVIDDFTDVAALNVTGTGSSSSSGSISGTQLAGTTNREVSLSTTTITGVPRRSDLNVDSGEVSLSLPPNHSGTASLNYTGFTPTNLVTAGNSEFAFGLNYEQATLAAPVTVTFTANGTSTRSITFDTGSFVQVEQLFPFTSFSDPTVFANLSSLVVRVSGGNANDVRFTSPIRAVPVPPAVVGTLLAAGLAAVKARKKKPVLAEKSEA